MPDILSTIVAIFTEIFNFCYALRFNVTARFDLGIESKLAYSLWRRALGSWFSPLNLCLKTSYPICCTLFWKMKLFWVELVVVDDVVWLCSNCANSLNTLARY